MTWEAIVLAGGKLEKDFSDLFKNLPSKAYLPIHGKPMGEYVLEALRGVPRLRRILTVIPQEAPALSGTVTISSGSTILESLAAGFDRLSPETEMGLVATCDLPCLTVESVEDFLLQCERTQAGLNYSFVSRSDSERVFPGVSHTYVKLVEGEFCGGGLLAIAPRNFSSVKRFAARVTANRKNLFALAGIFGISVLAKLVLRRLSIVAAEKRASQLLGFSAKGVFSRFPELAFNVDDGDTFQQAVRYCKEKLI